MLYSAILVVSLLCLSRNAQATAVLPPDEYWQASPPLNYSDALYAGWDQIPVEKEIMVYNGTEIGRTVRSIYRNTQKIH